MSCIKSGSSYSGRRLEIKLERIIIRTLTASMASSRDNDFFSGHPYHPPYFERFSMDSAPQFDILDWHPHYQNCVKYFLDHAQHEVATQSLCALINIRLPFQWHGRAIFSSTTAIRPGSSPTSSSSATMRDWPRAAGPPLQRDSRNGVDGVPFVSLVPYIRRLIVTGFDSEGVLHGFFGDAWKAGIGPLRECERRNYLFAAKHGGWRSCKKQYDLNEEETVPFLQPLRDVTAEELESAERSWSSWLEQEDWMLGPRTPRNDAAAPRMNAPSGSYDRSRK